MEEETNIGDAAEDDDSDLDGCDVEISDADATPDEDLPVTEGGVA